MAISCPLSSWCPDGERIDPIIVNGSGADGTVHGT